jgi:SpoVK/Ycf46/Vps4 family AAA+-type ATPase
VLSANIADISSKWHGEGPKIIHAMFEKAREMARHSDSKGVIILLGKS